MIIYKLVTRKIESIELVKCNMCANEIDHANCSYFSYTHYHGYGSARDLETDHIDLCNNCYDKWVNTFMINPKTEDPYL